MSLFISNAHIYLIRLYFFFYNITVPIMHDNISNKSKPLIMYMYIAIEPEIFACG